MELQAYPGFLLEVYQKIMKDFIDDGTEPEGKAQLRYLFHNQRVSISTLAPRPEDWNTWTKECIEKADWSGLCQVINQRGKGDMMPVIYGGYTHEKNFQCMLEGFACGNLESMERILPPELLKVNNSYDPFFPVAVHLLIGLWYRDGAVLEWAVPEAERFLEKKKVNLLDKSMLSFLLDLAHGDMAKGSEDLLAVCKGYSRSQKYVLGIRPFCTLAHGLYALAQILLPEDDFQALEMPKHKNFLQEFALWRREHPEPDLSLWFRYPEEMALFNLIYEAPPARLVLWQRDPDAKKPEWTAYGMKWVDHYVDELWEMGEKNREI